MSHSVCALPGSYPLELLITWLTMCDLAWVQIAALSASPIPSQQKWILIYNTMFKLKDMAEVIHQERPELVQWLPGLDAVPPKQTDAPLDMSSASQQFLRIYLHSKFCVLSCCLQNSISKLWHWISDFRLSARHFPWAGVVKCQCPRILDRVMWE